MTLTTGQQEAFDETVSAIEQSKWHLIKGYAGTGKSYLCKALLQRYPNAKFVTPTNKAAKVLTKDMGVPAVTLHKLFGLRPERGKLVHNGNIPSGKDPLFIDETSMISKELLTFIKMLPESKPVVFIGDPAQLPPVGEKISPVFEEVTSVSTLTEIVRQAADNPLIQYSLQLREQGYRVDNIPWGATIKRMPVLSATQFVQLLAKNYEQGGVYAAWRNKTVDAANEMCHKFFYPEAEHRFAVGEKIVLNAPLLDVLTKQTLADNGDEFVVKGYRLNSYREIETMELEVEGLARRIPTPTQAGLEQLDARLKQLADQKKWGEFYGLKEALPSIGHTYAFTCHKLQGSSYNRVIVNAADIMANRDHEERNRCMYVAVTRTRNDIIIAV